MKLPRLLAIWFLLFGTSFFFLPTANAVYTGVVSVTCVDTAGTQTTYRTGWDNSNQYFAAHGNIAAHFCDLVHHADYVGDSLTDASLRWYNGIVPLPVSPVEPSPSPVPTPSDTPTSSPEPKPIPSASPSPSAEPLPSETPTPQVSPLETQSATVDTNTATSDTSTIISDTSTVQDTVTVTVLPEPVPPAPVVMAPPIVPVVEPQPVVVPAPPPAPSPEPPAPEPEPLPEASQETAPVPIEEPAPPVEETPPAEQAPVEEPPAPEEVPGPPIPSEPPVIEEPEPPQMEPAEEIHPPMVADKNATDEEKVIVAAAIIEAAHGEPVTAQAIQAAGLTYQDLPPQTPVEVRQDENGNEVVITAEVAAALEVLADPAQLVTAIFTDPGQALLAIASIGADMSIQERKESQKIIVASVIAGQAAVGAAGAAAAATYRRKP